MQYEHVCLEEIRNTRSRKDDNEPISSTSITHEIRDDPFRKIESKKKKLNFRVFPLTVPNARAVGLRSGGGHDCRQRFGYAYNLLRAAASVAFVVKE